MDETEKTTAGPPRLRQTGGGRIENSSLADLIEWFLDYDERTARIRHPQTEELFQWKQHDDAAGGKTIYPFENAEARFAIGIFQALEANNSEPLLSLLISDVLAALHEARETKAEISEAYKLDDDPSMFALERAERLTNNAERRIYLTSCWLDALCTAEARVLGWTYQELYGRPFAAT